MYYYYSEQAGVIEDTNTNGDEPVSNMNMKRNEILTVESEIFEAPQGTRPGESQDNVSPDTGPASEQCEEEGKSRVSRDGSGTSSNSEEENDNWIDHSGPPVGIEVAFNEEVARHCGPTVIGIPPLQSSSLLSFRRVCWPKCLFTLLPARATCGL
jgi:hypothetical protein